MLQHNGHHYGYRVRKIYMYVTFCVGKFEAHFVSAVIKKQDFQQFYVDYKIFLLFSFSQIARKRRGEGMSS